MSLQPLLDAPIAIQIHAAAALVSVGLGPVALYQKRRATAHKVVGYVWVSSMLTVAISAFFIHTFAVIGPFSPLHGFAILTMGSLTLGIRYARLGNIKAHRAVFRNLYWFGLMLAGTANFLPGRIINQVVFGGQDTLGFAAIVICGLSIGYVAFRDRLTPRAEVAA